MSTETLEKSPTYEEERGKPMPSLHRAVAQTNLIFQLSQQGSCRIASELTLEFEGKPITPDISILPKEPLDWLNDEIQLRRPPISVVEIFSPTQGSKAIMDKVDDYFKNGVKSCWIVNPPFKSITFVSFAPFCEPRDGILF